MRETPGNSLAVCARLGILVLLACVLPTQAARESTTTVRNPTLRVPIGVTPLLDKRSARIGYRLDGADREVSLGVAWQGEDLPSGVQFRPVAMQQGRRTWFIHCPWRKGPGITFAEYSLDLPKDVPIRMRIAIGLSEDAPHSDGVTYRVRVDGRPVFCRHCRWKGLREFSVDLGAFAGKRVRLRLEVDPGPDRNTTDDWALWGWADIEAGTPEQIAAARTEAERRAAERRRADFTRAAAIASESLLPVAGADARSMRPSTLRTVRNQVQRNGATVVFAADDGVDALQFVVRPDRGVFTGLDVRWGGRSLVPAAFVGSMKAGEAVRELRLQGTTFDEKKRMLRCVYIPAAAASAESAKRRLDVYWSIQGKSLRVELSAPAGMFAGVSLHALGDTSVTAPLGPGAVYRDREQVYLSVVGDFTQSNASRIGHQGSTYVRLTDGSYNPLHDVFYLTASSGYAEVLANSPYPPSPFLKDLSHRVVLDVWGGAFRDDAAWLRRMHLYGLDHFVIIKHVWQRDGYDMTYPNTMPANAKLGGDAGLRELAQTAIGLGHRFCVHENYYDYYPNAEDFREEDCALNPDGTKQKGWQGSPVKAWILKPSKLMDYVKKFSPEIRKRYGCNAAYHDIMPTRRVDYDARAPGAGMIRYTHAMTRRLVGFDHALFGGPVLFEGLGTTLAGLYDGGTSGPLNEQTMPVAVGPELIIVHPKQSNHGMSYYERWLIWGYGPGWSSYVMTNRERDHYRAMTVAFGRTGFIGHQLMKNPHGVVREYYLFQAFGRAYTGQRVTHIRYEGDSPGQWIDAGAAARYNRLERLWITYEGGQQVYVNLAPQDWKIAGRVLPQYGILTVGPRAAAWTARVNGQIADFAQYDDVTYVDARTHWWSPSEDPHPIRARAVQFRDLGDGRFRIAVEWTPGRKIDRDRVVFWHFRDSRGIRFQSDHRPRVRTPQWHPNEAVVDGPYTLTAPKSRTTRYTFVVGLYDKTDREPLYGAVNELILGDLKVERTPDGGVRRIGFTPSERPFPPGTDPAPYAAGNNHDRRILDFGEVACNGALVIRRNADGMVITPVPLGEEFEVGLSGDIRRVIAEDIDGKPLGAVPLQRRGGRTWFRTTPRTAVRFRVER